MKLAIWILFISLDVTCWDVKEAARVYTPSPAVRTVKIKAHQDSRVIALGNYQAIKRFQIHAASGTVVPNWKWNQYPECFDVKKASITAGDLWTPTRSSLFFIIGSSEITFRMAFEPDDKWIHQEEIGVSWEDRQ